MLNEKKILVVATGNKNKLREIGEIFTDYKIVSQKEMGFDEDVEENGTTFEENALIKAEAAMKALHCPVIADDSGICVEALNGAPGIYSARYSGEHGNDKANRVLLLENMKDKENRTAYFQCSIALVYPDGRKYTSEGRTYGRIQREETGENGFGYDCIFFSDEINESFGIASSEAKNKVSHRYKALKALSEKIKNI